MGVERWKYYTEAEIAGLENAAQDKILNVICRQFLSFIAGSSATFPCSYLLKQCSVAIASHTHTHPFNGPLSGTTRVSRHQKGKTNLDFTRARDSEWQWYQLGHMQVCTSLQTDNHASTSLLKFFYRPYAVPAAQQTVSKH